MDITFKIPQWLEDIEKASSELDFSQVNIRMDFILNLARINIEHGGGPFAAAIFSRDDWALVASGINLVVSGQCSILHAEIVAIMRSSQKMSCFSFNKKPGFELTTTTEPCVMCLGATIWSGVKQLVCGARDEDARAIGFDEGPKPKDWQKELEKRGIMVKRDVCHEKAVQVLKNYASNNGVIYNG